VYSVLIMRSVKPEDLTARARIRDAALGQLADRGLKGTSLREIAAEAGVTPGLVQHHYGSKEGLRAACDAYVLDIIRLQATELVDERRVGDETFITSAYAGGPLLTRYLVRALLDGSPASNELFDEIVRLTEAYLSGLATGTHDPGELRARAAVFAAMKLGLGVFQEHLVRVLGVRDLARDGYPRIARATLDLLSDQAVNPALAAEARAGLDRYQRSAAEGASPRHRGGNS
jgi:AcrR family transcriptional regulator